MMLPGEPNGLSRVKTRLPWLLPGGRRPSDERIRAHLPPPVCRRQSAFDKVEGCSFLLELANAGGSAFAFACFALPFTWTRTPLMLLFFRKRRGEAWLRAGRETKRDRALGKVEAVGTESPNSGQGYLISPKSGRCALLGPWLSDYVMIKSAKCRQGTNTI